MYASRLGRANKLVVHFGGMDCVESRVEKYTIGKPTVNDSEIRKVTEKARKELIDELSKRADVKEIVDLYDTAPRGLTFEPILFRLSIPRSLQTTVRYPFDANAFMIQEFAIVYDGEVLTIAALCPVNKQPEIVSFAAARDWVEALLKGICDFTTCAPCVTHEAVVFISNKASAPQETRDVYVPLPSNSQILSIFRVLYLEFCLDLHSFYYACGVCDDTDASVLEIRRAQGLLIQNGKAFIETRWHQIFRKRRITRELRVNCIGILETICKYLDLRQTLLESVSSVRDLMRQNAILRRFMKAVNLKEYTSSEEADVNSILSVVEHIRGELETYSVSSSQIVSALLGGVIGSALTIGLSYFLSSFSPSLPTLP